MHKPISQNDWGTAREFTLVALSHLVPEDIYKSVRDYVYKIEKDYPEPTRTNISGESLAQHLAAAFYQAVHGQWKGQP